MKEIVRLPSVNDPDANNTGSSTSEQATVLAKKPVRPQPPGLKMRFRPIGFGNGKLGNIGLSPLSADGNDEESASDEDMEDAPQQFHRPASLEQESATSSSGDESSSSSDAEMADAPPLKSKPQKSAAKEPVKAALKRKASDGGDMKAKNSSSSSATSTYRQLNTVKKK